MTDSDVVVKASKLLRRVRRGDLTRDRLEVLALIDYPPAVEALGDEAPRIPRDIKRWIKKLDAYGPQVSARMIITCARLLLPVLEEGGGAAAQEASDAVRLGEAWIANPTEETARTALTAHSRAVAAAVKVGSDAEETAALVAAFAALVPTTPIPAMDIVADTADTISSEAVRREVRRDLARWALRSG